MRVSDRFRPQFTKAIGEDPVRTGGQPARAQETPVGQGPPPSRNRKTWAQLTCGLAPVARDDAPAIYPEDSGLSVQDFMRSPAFKKANRQYLEILKGLKNFAQTNANNLQPPWTPQTLSAVDKSIGSFARKLDTNGGFDHFDAHLCSVYGSIKQGFHELDRKLQDTSIPLQRRMDAVQALAGKIDLCAGGVADAQKDAMSRLHGATGLTTTARAAVTQMAESVIAEHIRTAHSGLQPGIEVHVGNAYLEVIGPEWGLKPAQDPLIELGRSEVNTLKLRACQARMRERIEPVNLAIVLADHFRTEAMQAVATTGVDTARPLTGADLTRANQQLNDAEPMLQQTFGKVPRESFFQLVEHDQETAGQFTKGDSLVAVHFLEQLSKAGLVGSLGATEIHRSQEAGQVTQIGSLLFANDDDGRREVKPSDLFKITPESIVKKLQEQGITADSQATALHAVAEKVLRDVDAGHLTPGDVPSGWVQSLIETSTRLAGQGGEPTRPKPWLTLATRLNMANDLNRMARAGVDINHPDGDGKSSFMLACELGHVESVAAMSEFAVNAIEQKDKVGRSALMLAAENGHAEVVETLIRCKPGIELNALDHAAKTPVLIAAEKGHAGVLNVLLDAGAALRAPVHGAEPNNPLFFATWNGHVDAFRVLLSKDPNLYYPKLACLAAQEGQTDIIKELVAHNPDVSARDDLGRTPAIIAAEEGKTETLAAILEGNANINAVDHQGYTAVLAATFAGHSAALQVLVDKGADVNAATLTPGATHMQMTPLMISCEEGRVECVRALLSAPTIDVNVRTAGVETAFTLTPKERQDIKTLLLAAGAKQPTFSDRAEIFMRTISKSGRFGGM